MKHLFELEANTFMQNEDNCGVGSCQTDCTQSCTGTGWCFLNIGH